MRSRVTAAIVIATLLVSGAVVSFPDPASAATTTEISVVAWAKSQVGTDLDPVLCLRFVRSAWASAGVELKSYVSVKWNGDSYPQSIWGTFTRGTTGGANTTPPQGALVFFNAKPGYSITYSHVMLALGNENNVSTADAYNEHSTDPDSVHEETLQEEKSSGAYSTYVGWWLPDGTATSTSSAGKTAPAKTTSECPTSGQLLTAWRKSRGIMLTSSRVKGFTHITCWRNWVIAAPIAVPEGNGLFEFNRTPTLHGLTATEVDEFDRQVCANAVAYKKWYLPGMC
jgi:hypothetical protein